jgi:hypothetical protein
MLGSLTKTGMNDTKALIFVPWIFKTTEGHFGILWYTKFSRTWAYHGSM